MSVSPLSRPCAACDREFESYSQRERLCAGCADRQDDARCDELLERAQEREAREWQA
jgi:hypothetical protein